MNSRYRMRVSLYRSIAMTVVAGILSSCSTFYTSKPVDQTPDNYQGVLYALPMLQYKVVASRRVAQCDPLKIIGKVDVTATYIADPFATFNLDYREMAAVSSTSEFDVDLYDDSRLKSINSSADDRTADIIKNSFSVLSNVALASAGVAPPAVVAPGAVGVAPPAVGQVLPGCSNYSKIALEALSATEGKLNTLKGSVGSLTAEVERLTLLLVSTGGSAESVVAELNEVSKQLAASKTELELLINARRPFVGKVTYTENRQWPKSTKTMNESIGNSIPISLPLEMPENVLRKWWENYEDTVDSTEGREIMENVVFTMKLNRMTDTVANKRPDKSVKGVHYRHSVPVELLICSGIECKQDATNTLKTNVNQSPQHGPYVTLPFENKAFQNNSLNVMFGQNGAPNKVTFKNMRAALAEATGAAANVASQLPSLRQQILNKELEALKRKSALAEERSKLEAAEAALEVSPTADLDAQTALLNAEVALLTAQISRFEKQEELKKHQTADGDSPGS